jgi:hypothetical protein
MKKISNKKLQEKCWEDAQAFANEINESIVYDDQEDKFYLGEQYRKECEKVVLDYKKEYTEEDWKRDSSNSHLTWYHPTH